jgi:hypothetical protein
MEWLIDLLGPAGVAVWLCGCVATIACLGYLLILVVEACIDSLTVWLYFGS